MSIIRTILGPASKYDKSLPYTYEARIDVLKGQADEPVFNSYFSDTICSLIEYLDEQNIAPDDVELYGIYLGREIRLDPKHCIDRQGQWLKRPSICKALEGRYKKTMEERYKGHTAKGECAFDDRERKPSGPY